MGITWLNYEQASLLVNIRLGAELQKEVAMDKVQKSSVVRLEILNPAGEAEAVAKKALALRPSTLDGKRLGLIFNQKPGGEVLLARTAELLKERYKIAEVNWFSRVCCVAPPEGYIESAVKGSDIAVAAAAE